MILETIFIFLFVGVGFVFCKRVLELEEDSIIIHLALGIAATCFGVLLIGYFGILGQDTIIALSVFSLYGWLMCRPKLTFTKDQLIVGVMFAVLAYIFLVGSSMPWLEDSDPVEHSSGIIYISQFHSVLQPTPTYVRYLSPYPPIYDALMYLHYSITGDAPQTLKVMNALLCALAIPFAYMWMKERYGENKALWGAFILMALPCFMSHFIWAQTLAVLMMFPALYFFEKIKKGSPVPFILTAAVVFMTQPSVAFIFGIILLIYAVFQSRDLYDHMYEPLGINQLLEETKIFSYIAVAVLIACIFYWIPIIGIYGIDNTLDLLGVTGGAFGSNDTSGGVVYDIWDIVSAPENTKIDQATGLGLGIAIFVLIGLYDAVKEKDWFTLIMFGFCLLGIEGNALPIKLFPHRFWVFLSIPVAILASKGISNFLEKMKDTWSRHFVTVMIVALIVIFSLAVKAEVQMMKWSPGMFVTENQFLGYLNLQKLLPHETLIYNYCAKETIADGSGLRGRVWDAEVWNWKGFNRTIEQDYEMVKSKNYSYVIIDESCMEKNDIAVVQKRLNELNNNNGFALNVNLSSANFVVFEVK